MFWVLVGLLSGAGQGVTPPPVEQPLGNYNTFGYYTPPSRKKRPVEPEIVAEIEQAATEPVFRKPPAPKPIRVFRPEPVRIDESAVLSAMAKARREWVERDEDDAIALAIILANA